MLTGKQIGKRIEDALLDAKRTKAGLAEHCGVTPQAVTGWVKHGRISKGRIEKVAEYTSKPLDYFLGDVMIPLTRMVIGDEDADDVRAFLTADAALRKLWLQVVNKKDLDLAHILRAYEQADKLGRQMILNGAKGAELLARGREDANPSGGRRSNRKRD